MIGGSTVIQPHFRFRPLLLVGSQILSRIGLTVAKQKNKLALTVWRVSGIKKPVDLARNKVFWLAATWTLKRLDGVVDEKKRELVRPNLKRLVGLKVI